ncbi:HAT domain-containing protein [Macrophomina phaseolina MS6]|uniref:HAT domain-containing protein n=1 Tax=Macrophomina phaseolina (strain MS6) TaxID=1126212 RepID=K2R5N0_MACPH|nr:HAT domain-containing protein [Macrophomina phaseolina MS6]
MGWWVLSKYYAESDKTPVYATALLLHPEKRRKYVDRHWEKDWREPAIAAARQYWAKYKDRPVASTPATKLDGGQRELSTYERLKQSMSVLDGADDEDDFERFVNATPKHMTKTSLEWWCREEQRLEYPRLYQMAIEVLSVPAMSDDPERVSSCTKRTISWDRTRLSAEAIEKLECLGNWVQNDLIRKFYVAVGDEIIDIC